MKYAPWIIVAITSTIAAGLLLRGPNVVTREVPVEVIKTVTKEVERQLTSQETYAIKQYELLKTALYADKSTDVLKGMVILAVEVGLDKVLITKWSQSEIEEKFKLELRKIGIEVVKADDPRCRGSLHVTGNALINENETITYVLRWEIRSTITSMQWDFHYRKWSAIHASGAYFGTFGSEKVVDGQRNAVDNLIVNLSNKLLEANPIKRN